MPTKQLVPDASAPPPGSAPIWARGITKRFGKLSALHDVSLEVPGNSVYALIGANGTGKSTLMRVLLNIHRANEGESSVLGIASRDLRPRHFERIGYVAEGQHSPDWLTAAQYGEFLAPFYPRWDAGRYAELCRTLRVPGGRAMDKMSRGTRMKALLAGALAYRPACLLLDEPLGGLDPLAREEIMQVLREAAKEGGGTTILISSHDLLEIEAMATHIGFLEDGRLLFSEPIADLKARHEGLTLREIFLKLARAAVTREAA